MIANQSRDDRNKYRLAQIRSIADAEALGSPLFLVHTGVIMCAALGSILLFGNWPLAGTCALYVVVLSLEKIVAARVAADEKVSQYGLVLALLSLRATLYNALVLLVWAQDGDIFKLVALALLVAATINIFVFHATYPAVMFSVVAPIWLGFGLISAFFVAQYGNANESIAAIAVFLGISPYFYLSLMQASQSWGELDKTRTALTQSQKHDALGKLASGVAHDFNNIVAITMGAADLLKDGEDPERDALADEIIQASERGAALSSQLLAFGRSTALEPAEYAIAEIFDELKSMIDRLLPQSITTIISIQPNTPHVFADRYQLETALLNLVINARDAMPDGGTLGLHASGFRRGHEGFPPEAEFAADMAVAITVTDTGKGIPNAIKGQVFDPFFTTKPIGEGSGLGLSMVAGFAAQSGGAIRLKSTMGQGTTIKLILPVAETCTEKAVEVHREELGSGDSHILLVEDEAALRSIIAQQLVAKGYRVTTAATGDDAEKILSTGFVPNLVITDMVMPGQVQGHDLARIARTLISEIPIIFLSGYTNHALSEQTALNPQAQMLRKPVQQEKLLATIQEALA